MTEVSSVPILGKTLGELQDWAVKLNGGNWSSDGTAQLWIREGTRVSSSSRTFLETAKGSDKDYSGKRRGCRWVCKKIALEDDTPMMVGLGSPVTI